MNTNEKVSDMQGLAADIVYSAITAAVERVQRQAQGQPLTVQALLAGLPQPVDDDDDTVRRDIGRRLQLVRKLRGLSQSQLAALVGGKLNRSMLANYEQGRYLPPYPVLRKICKALDTTSTEILGF